MSFVPLAALALATAGAPAAPAESPYAIKVGPDTNDVRILPLSASAAEAKYGVLPAAEAHAVQQASDAFFAHLSHPAAAWSGPALHANRIECGGAQGNLCRMFFEPVDAAALDKKLAGATVYDPYSLGSMDGRNFAVEVIKLRAEGSAEQTSYLALAFVLTGAKVDSIVVNPQPWIVVMQAPPRAGAERPLGEGRP